jgi:hypothetical protein
MEVVVAAGIVEFIGYGSNCFGFERSLGICRCADLKICRWADVGWADGVMTINELK